MQVEYDFIIVGAGAAGGLLASRLSLDYRVLLIEAGPNRNDDERVKIPGRARSLQDSDLDWQYVTEPEPGMNGRSIKQPAGRLLGGSSAINSHVIAHTSRAVHDEWVRLGNSNWSWEAMQPFYRFATLDTPCHYHYDKYTGISSAGIHASFNQDAHPLQRAWSESCDRAVDGGPGVSSVANAIDGSGHRSHSGVAFVEPALRRLKLLQGTVDKILFNGHQAIGVLVDSEQVYGGEVILCAGAYGSAKLLELSGIGNGDPVPAWLNLPVGENLQDHPNFTIAVEVKDGVPTRDDVANIDRSQGATYDFIYDSLDASSLRGLHLTDPFLRKVVYSADESTANLVLIKGNRYPEPKGHFLGVIIMYSYPVSRGSSHITSDDPAARPKIKMNYFSDPQDLEVFARHVLQCEQLLEGPLKNYIKPGGVRIPEYKPDLESIKDAIREHAYTNYHACGTCSMKARDKGGVVDQDLKVFGTTGLRVCDASIIPVIPRANILSTVYAIAEKAADLISAEYSAIKQTV